MVKIVNPALAAKSLEGEVALLAGFLLAILGAVGWFRPDWAWEQRQFVSRTRRIGSEADAGVGSGNRRGGGDWAGGRSASDGSGTGLMLLSG